MFQLQILNNRKKYINQSKFWTTEKKYINQTFWQFYVARSWILNTLHIFT